MLSCCNYTCFNKTKVWTDPECTLFHQVNVAQRALLIALTFSSYSLLLQTYCPRTRITAKASLQQCWRRFTSPKMKEVSAIMSCSHLPGELRLEHSCTETAGPAVAHQSPPVPHRHSHPPRCYSCTGRSVRWKLEPEMPRGSIRDSTTALFFSAFDQRECRWALSAITSKEILKEQRRLQDENKN